MNVITAGPLAADVFAALHAAAFAPAWSAATIHGTLLGLGAFGLIAMDDDTPCGMLLATAAADSAEVLTVAVPAPARRRGAGRALVRAALHEAHLRGAQFLFLEVAADNAAARGLYEGLGFEQVGVRRGYYESGPNPPRDALVLRKSTAI